MFPLILKELQRVAKVMVVNIEISHQTKGNKRQERAVPPDRAPAELLLVKVFEDEWKHDRQSSQAAARRQHAQERAGKPALLSGVVERSDRQAKEDALRIADVQKVSSREDGEVKDCHLGGAPAVFLFS